MHRHFLLSAASAALLTGLNACADAQSPARAGQDLYFGFTRLDPDARTITPDSYVVAADGNIVEIGAGQVPTGEFANRIDLTGTYGLPGFVDAHAHITAGPHSFQMVDGAPLISIESFPHITEYHARMALAFGVTSVRNPGGDPEANADYDARIASGEWAGPDAVHAGAVIQPPPMGGNAFAYPQGREAWMAEAERQAALGMRYFKLYHGLTEEELALGIEAAHAHGMEAIAHLDQVSWQTAADLGIDALLHGLPTSSELIEPEHREAYIASRGPDTRFMYRWFELADFDGPILQRLIGTLAERQIEVDLTLLVNAIVYSEDPFAEFTPESDLQYFHPTTLAAAMQFADLGRMGWTDDDYHRAEAAQENVYEFVRRLHAAGVPLLIGTDGNGGAPNYALELLQHEAAGLERWEILRLATSASAEGIGMTGTGRLAAGHEADMVFLNANPLDDLNHARDVHTVVTNGHAYTFEALTAAPPQSQSLED
ncbi:amidohydrolase family protein [Hyphobacterium sp.]|jgi:imidazolonepropionase-like amidohydrolase|uniref:amidohydrolase family protein n=1 Tax=Hyphobacterium sp. TaxID=2004662 RepID=UPI003BAC1566